MSKLTSKLSPRVKAELDKQPQQPTQPSVSSSARYQRKRAVEPEPETIPDPWETEPEESELVSLVKQTSQAPVDDTIVHQIYTELEDIDTKLQTIGYLKAMERPLRKRVRALMSTLSKLQEARQDMVAVGATELKPLSEQDKAEIAQVIDHVNTSILNAYKVPPEVMNGDDFR